MRTNFDIYVFITITGSIIKTKVLLPHGHVTLADFGYILFKPFGFIASNTCLTFQSFDFERTL